MQAHRKEWIDWLLTISLAFTSLGLPSAIETASAADAVQLLGVAEFLGTAIDQSGLDDVLGGNTPHNRLGGLSAIEYSGADNLYFVLSDRGPKDGDARFTCRWHTVELKIPARGPQKPSPRLISTTLLHAADGKPFIGLASAFDRNGPDGDRRLDPEGIRRGPSGTLFVSDEYGPKIVEFDTSGHALRSLTIPSRYLIRHPSASKEEEITRNSSGRVSNSGFESLAIGNDGKRLYTLTQTPLLQDSAATISGKRKGLNCRMLEIDLETGATREFLYPLERQQTKLSEMLAVGDRQFLVIERDGEAGQSAGFKRIMKIDLADATDTSAIESFPANGLPAGVRPVQKSTFIDLLDPRIGLAGPQLAEKQEGLAWGPPLSDGRALLWVCVDNDFKENGPSLFYAFAIRNSAANTLP